MMIRELLAEAIQDAIIAMRGDEHIEMSDVTTRKTLKDNRQN